MPTTLREARELFAASAAAREIFGDEVVDHYVNAADVELAAFEGAVTDWERRREDSSACRSTTSSTRRPSRSSPPSSCSTPRPPTPPSPGPPPRCPPGGRSPRPTAARLLRRFADVVDAHVEELARLEVRGAGHTIGNARWEAGNVRDVLHYYAGAPERLFGRQIPVAGGIDVTFAEPVGVVGVIVPWNFPMPIAGWGFAPALAAGCTVVLKPAELTPLTAVRLGELALEAGVPEGVFQVLPGQGVRGRAAVRRPPRRPQDRVHRLDRGRDGGDGRRCAAQVKRVTLELGGKSANIVFADADLEKAAATAPYGVFDNAGQDCCARSRILVERSVYDRFLALLEPAVRAVVVKDPGADDAEMGPLISARQRSTSRSYVEDATEPVDVAFRGEAPSGPGFWYPPTVVLPRSPGRTGSGARRCSGRSSPCCRSTTRPTRSPRPTTREYGLSGSIWTRDVGRALRVARGVESGNLSVNSHSSVRYSTPFGGFKRSGLGRELGPDALAAFTETKNVFIAARVGTPTTDCVTESAKHGHGWTA